MNSSPLLSRLLLFGCLGLCSSLARAQSGVSPEAAPGRDEATNTSSTAASPVTPASPVPVTPSTPLPPAPTAPVVQGSATQAPVSRLTAPRVAVEAGTIVAQGDGSTPAIIQSPLGRLQAQELRVDTLDQSVRVPGTFLFERELLALRKELRPRTMERLFRRETVTQTLSGRNLTFSYRTRRGSLDDAQVRSNVDVRARHIELDGTRTVAQDAVVRPGGLSDEELKIYGTPPLSLRAREVVLRQTQRNRLLLSARGAGLYAGKTRLLPVPATVFRSGLGSNNNQAFRLTPGISFNSADRVLVTTRFALPLSSDPRALLLGANLGYSQRAGFRGGLSLESSQTLGDFRLSGIYHDIVTTQLTNRLQVDRKPELAYSSPAFATFVLPAFGRSGFSLDGTLGSYSERVISGTPAAPVSSNRFQGRLLFSTRLDQRTGPFVRLFALTTHYASTRRSYDATGAEFGYAGRFVPRVSGEISLRLSRVRGQTPFQFDLIEIPRELRTTFDFELTPRFLVPVDVRYDLGQTRVRDSTIGLLRNYKVFAYGVVYQSVRRDLRLEVRSAF